MPISDDALQKEKNRFIAVKGDAKFGQAIAALNAVGGQPWWYVVVQLNDGSWRAARISEIAAPLATNKNAAEIRLRDAAELNPAAVIERNSLETKAAQVLARKSPGGVLVVTDNGAAVGILVEGVRRGGGTSGLALSSTSLDQLGGKYAKLKDYGSILLNSSKK
jgi:thiamine pyrophosphate-dependent acetolactate synthase large subunit-like protein